jgi:elongation factor G
MEICSWFARLEEAQAEPENLAQETIIEKLDPREAARLSKVRNIGIAVGSSHW